jgi:hypothetical protein
VACTLALGTPPSGCRIINPSAPRRGPGGGVTLTTMNASRSLPIRGAYQTPQCPRPRLPSPGDDAWLSRQSAPYDERRNIVSVFFPAASRREFKIGRPPRLRVGESRFRGLNRHLRSYPIAIRSPPKSVSISDRNEPAPQVRTMIQPILTISGNRRIHGPQTRQSRILTVVSSADARRKPLAG